MSDGLQFGFSGDAAEIAVRWLQSLKSERRMAAKTLEAYARDVSQFGQFLKDHLGQPAVRADLAGLTIADFRSFMARRRKNRRGKPDPCAAAFGHPLILPLCRKERLFHQCGAFGAALAKAVAFRSKTLEHPGGPTSGRWRCAFNR